MLSVVTALARPPVAAVIIRCAAKVKVSLQFQYGLVIGVP
jgi:hypothetical protein